MINNENEYIIKLEIDEVSLREFVTEQITTFLYGSIPDHKNTMIIDPNIVNLAEYHIIVDKETYHPKSIHMRIDAKLPIAGSELDLIYGLDVTYENYNEVEAIVLPE